MKVSELIKELRKLPKDADVYLCKDWDDQDEEGHYLDLYRLDYVLDQTIFTETAMDFTEEHQIILDFETKRAEPRINKDYD